MIIRAQILKMLQSIEVSSNHLQRINNEVFKTHQERKNFIVSNYGLKEKELQNSLRFGISIK